MKQAMEEIRKAKNDAWVRDQEERQEMIDKISNLTSQLEKAEKVVDISRELDERIGWGCALSEIRTLYQEALAAFDAAKEE